jgi:hypothetical protein
MIHRQIAKSAESAFQRDKGNEQRQAQPAIIVRGARLRTHVHTVHVLN